MQSAGHAAMRLYYLAKIANGELESSHSLVLHLRVSFVEISGYARGDPALFKFRP